MDLRCLLESHLKKKNVNPVTDEDQKNEAEALFEDYYKKSKLIDQKTSTNLLPKFYHKVPSEQNPLKFKLREESRSRSLQRKSQELLDNDELKNVYLLLDKHQSPPISEEPMIHYEDFLKVRDLAGPKCKQYFKASTFCKLLSNDRYGRIPMMNFFNYVMRKVWLHQTRIGLSLYDSSGHGFLKELELEEYILDLIPTLPQLKDLEKSFHSFYVCTVVRKFFFFLDSLRIGQIKIQDMLTCNFLDALLELREDLPKEKQQSNWFSAQSALRVYGMYLNLDKDHNGMLSKSELMKYGMGTLTPVFIDRVFQEYLTYDGEMDYKTYLDFILALENKKEPQSLHYFFKILDIDGKGYLTTFTLNYFFRSIQEQMRQHSQEEPVCFEDVKDEIFDMVKPINPTRITLQDLIACGQGDVIVSILIDLNGFWSHETREIPASDSAEEGIKL